MLFWLGLAKGVIMNPILTEIKTQGPKVSSKSPLWLFLTKEEPKEDEDKEKTIN